MSQKRSEKVRRRRDRMVKGTDKRMSPADRQRAFEERQQRRKVAEEAVALRRQEIAADLASRRRARESALAQAVETQADNVGPRGGILRLVGTHSSHPYDYVPVTVRGESYVVSHVETTAEAPATTNLTLRPLRPPPSMFSCRFCDLMEGGLTQEREDAHLSLRAALESALKEGRLRAEEGETSFGVDGSFPGWAQVAGHATFNSPGFRYSVKEVVEEDAGSAPRTLVYVQATRREAPRGSRTRLWSVGMAMGLAVALSPRNR